MGWCLRSVGCNVTALVTKIARPKVQGVLFNSKLSAAERAATSAALQPRDNETPCVLHTINGHSVSDIYVL
jgi:hypothetical protein